MKIYVSMDKTPAAAVSVWSKKPRMGSSGVWTQSGSYILDPSVGEDCGLWDMVTDEALKCGLKPGYVVEVDLNFDYWTKGM